MKTIKTTRTMRNLNFFYSIVLATTLMISCNKEDTGGVDNDCDGVCETVSYNTMEAFFEENGVDEQTFVIDATNGGVITGDQGTIITFPANGFTDANGNVVTGDIDIKIKEIFTASEMILSNRPTNAINDLGENTFLLSEGETEIIVEQNGEELSLGQRVGVEIKVPSTGGEDLDMRAFSGDVDEDDVIVWNQVSNTETYFTSLPNSYIYTAFNTGWSNCDKFYSYPGDKTTNYVDLTSSPNRGETRVFIVFKENNLPAVVRFTQNYTDGVQSYINSLPVGLEVTFVALTIEDNQQYLAVEEIVIAKDAYINLSFSAVSTDDITDQLALLN